MSFPLETVMPTFECRNKREISQVFCEMDNTSVPFLAKDEIVAETFCEDPKEHFESNTGDGVELSLEDVLLYVMDHNKKLSSPPTEFSPKEFLESLIKDCDRQDQMSKSITCAATYTLSNLDTFSLLARIIWCRISEIFQNYLVENVEETRMTNANFTFTTANIHGLFFTNAF